MYIRMYTYYWDLISVHKLVFCSYNVTIPTKYCSSLAASVICTYVYTIGGLYARAIPGNAYMVYSVYVYTCHALYIYIH